MRQCCGRLLIPIAVLALGGAPAAAVDDLLSLGVSAGQPTLSSACVEGAESTPLTISRAAPLAPGVGVWYCARTPDQLEATPWIYIGARRWGVVDRTCALIEDGSAHRCRATPDPGFVAYLNATPGVHLVEMTFATDVGESARSAPAVQITHVERCPYQPPGATELEERPVGYVVHGHNQLDPNLPADRQRQAERIAQLRAWGFRTEWQLNPWERNRVLIFATCVGPAQ